MDTLDEAKHWARDYLELHIHNIVQSDPTNIIDALAVLVYCSLKEEK